MKNISDYYALMVKVKVIEDILKYSGGKWGYNETALIEGRYQKFEGLDNPVIDLENGYIKYSYKHEACSINTELALFISEGKRNFLAVNNDYYCIEGVNNMFRIYEQIDQKDFKDATNTVMNIKWIDFLDKLKMKGDVSDNKLEELGPYLRLGYKLPRLGTELTVLIYALPDGQVGSDQLKIKEARMFLEKYKKYSTLKFGWNTGKTRFELIEKLH